MANGLSGGRGRGQDGGREAGREEETTFLLRAVPEENSRKIVKGHLIE